MLSLDFSSLQLRTGFVVGIFAIVSTVACSDAGTAPKPVTVATSASSAVGGAGGSALIGVSPAIDGIMTSGEWDGAATTTFPITIPGRFFNFTSTAKVYATHDDTYLYLAVTFDRKSFFREGWDYVAFDFDDNNNGQQDLWEDAIYHGVHQSPTDAFATAYYTEMNDVASSGVNNTFGYFNTFLTNAVVEIRKELNSADPARDFSIDMADAPIAIGMRPQVRLAGLMSNTSILSVHPSESTFCRLVLGKQTTGLGCNW